MEKCRAVKVSFWMQSRPSPQNWGYSGTVWAWLQSVCIAAPWITHTDTHTEHRYAGVQLLDIKMRTAHEESSSSSGAQSHFHTQSHTLLLRYKTTYLHFAKQPGEQTLVRVAGFKEELYILCVSVSMVPDAESHGSFQTPQTSLKECQQQLRWYPRDRSIPRRTSGPFLRKAPVSWGLKLGAL